jgi:hypothetical protein
VETFETATALTPRGEAAFAWVVPDGWQQGRGAWGGLVVGALIQAVEAVEPERERTVRSVTANLVAPAVVGEHLIQAAVVRRGSAVTTATANLIDVTGAQVATATVILGAPRLVSNEPDYGSWSMLSVPAAPPSSEVPVLDIGPPMGPTFLQHLAPRLVQGVPAENVRPETMGWIDYARPVTPSAASVVALVDAWWPASLVASESMRPVATVSFAANLLVEPSSLTVGEPLLHHGFVTAADEGYTSEHRRLWTADGRLAVDNLQSIVLIA